MARRGPAGAAAARLLFGVKRTCLRHAVMSPFLNLLGIRLMSASAVAVRNEGDCNRYYPTSAARSARNRCARAQRAVLALVAYGTHGASGPPIRRPWTADAEMTRPPVVRPM